MEKTNLLTKTSKNIWHYHPIGSGFTMTYTCVAKKVITTNNHTGAIIESNFVENIDSIDDFYQFCKQYYMNLIEADIQSLDLSYYDDPTYVGMIKVEVDLKLMEN